MVIIDKKRAYVFYNLGLVHFQKGEYKEAILIFDKAIKLNPALSISWYYKGLSQKELKNYADSIKSFDQALKSSPNFIQALIEKGDSFIKLGNLGQAKTCYEEIKVLNPKYAKSYLKKLKVISKTNDKSSNFTVSKSKKTKQHEHLIPEENKGLKDFWIWFSSLLEERKHLRKLYRQLEKRYFKLENVLKELNEPLVKSYYGIYKSRQADQVEESVQINLLKKEIDLLYEDIELIKRERDELFDKCVQLERQLKYLSSPLKTDI